MTPAPSPSSPTVHLGEDDLARQLAADVRVGLTGRPKWLAPKYFYDARGSELFDQITRLPEYYPTRAEAEILAAHADDIAAASGAETLVELGSGTSEKTRRLIDALRRRGTLRRFVPFDVDPAVLAEAVDQLAGEYPDLAVEPIVGDFEVNLPDLPRFPRRLMAFLGSTIGNLDPGERAELLADVRRTLGEDDHFLLGTDLVKDPARLVAAYDDAQGVTAEFNRNVLHVLRNQLGADVDPDSFEHVAVWDAEHERIEMRLRSARAQTVRFEAIEETADFAEGEEVLTEISSKFRRERVEEELGAAGLRMTHWWTDAAGDYALSLSVCV